MKEIQENIKQFCSTHNLASSVNGRILDLVSEVGEVAKEVLKASSYGQTETTFKNEALTLELGDVFFSFLCLANSLDIDAHSALELALAKYEKRLSEKRKICSED